MLGFDWPKCTNRFLKAHRSSAWKSRS